MAEGESILSPGFRMAAARAGWDEESLLLATLVVEDTPVRESRHKKRTSLIKSPSTSSSNRKRRSRKRPDSIPAIVLSLDDEIDDDKDNKKPEEKKEEEKTHVKKEKKEQVINSSEEPSSSKELPCMDKLREELTCGICLEICFEPTSTPCGHSFCMKCLKQSATKCGKRCPECRQLISTSRSSINTILWNTIQLLFPNEIETRRKSQIEESSIEIPRTNPISTTTNQSSRRMGPSGPNFIMASQLVQVENLRRMGSSSSVNRESQSEDAMLAQSLQRDEYLLAFSEGPSSRDRPRNSVNVHSASANLRAMASRASRAVHFRYRNRHN